MARKRNAAFFVYLPGGFRIRRERVRQVLVSSALMIPLTALLVFGLTYLLNEM